MPYVNIRFVRERKTTREQREALIRGITNLLKDVLKKNPATTIVVLDEVDPESYGIGGETVALRKKRRGG